MKYKIELTTLDDVKDFTQLVQTAAGDVRLSKFLHIIKCG